MKCSAMVAVAVLALTMPVLHAQEAALDLRVPPPPAVVDAATASDPPGTYYGDGVDAPASSTVVTGGVTTAVGYSRAFGTGTSVGADLDVSHVDSEGRNFDLHIDVSRSDGFPGQAGYVGQPGYFGGYPGRRN